MAKPELGLKRVCVACNARFYDLLKTPPACPRCGTEQPLEQPRLRRPAGNVADTKVVKKPADAPGAEDIEVEGVEDAEDDTVLEEEDDLEDDADAIGAEIEVETESDDREG